MYIHIAEDENIAIELQIRKKKCIIIVILGLY